MQNQSETYSTSETDDAQKMIRRSPSLLLKSAFAAVIVAILAGAELGASETNAFYFAAIRSALLGTIAYSAYRIETRVALLLSLAVSLFIFSRSESTDILLPNALFAAILLCSAFAFGTKSRHGSMIAAKPLIPAPVQIPAPPVPAAGKVGVQPPEKEVRKEDFMEIMRRKIAPDFSKLEKYISFLKVYMGKFSDEKAGMYADRIEHQFRTIDRTLQELLSFSRIDFDDYPLRIEEFDANKLFEETVEAAQRSASKHSIVFLPTVRSFARGDRFKIRKVLDHLIRNGIKYSPEGGKVIVGVSEEDDRIIGFVRDFGVGISDEQLGLMSKAFETISGKDTVKGLGIGLYTANAIIQAHGGSMWIKGKRSKGTVVYFHLPKANRSNER